MLHLLLVIAGNVAGGQPFPSICMHAGDTRRRHPMGSVHERRAGCGGESKALARELATVTCLGTVLESASRARWFNMPSGPLIESCTRWI